MAPVEGVIAPGHQSGTRRKGFRPLDMGGNQRDVDHGKEAASVPAVANQVRKRIPLVSAIHADVVAAERDDLQLADVKWYTRHQ